MITYGHYVGSTLRIGAELASSNRLFVNGWMLEWVFSDLKGYDATGSKLVLAFQDNVPIAVAVYYRQNNQVMAFTRKHFRGQGIGKNCVKRLDFPSTAIAGEGIDGTLEFWQKFGIAAHPRNYTYYPRGKCLE